MRVWDVLGKRRSDDEFEVVGAVKAPDLELALILAKETHFRHKEGVEYAVRLRGDDVIHPGPYEGELLGGVTDHSYRRQDAYAGVGGKLRRISEDFAEKHLQVEAPRPSTGRGHRDARHQDVDSDDTT
jgi:1,2-phenylacetyl-CoA epoxidase PaaB subunit